MGLVELFFIAVGLSMDAFAVSVCKGLSVRRARAVHMLCVGLYFGGFQALMPTVGYLLGTQFAGLIERVDHWIAFALLGFIGMNMAREALHHEEEHLDASFSARAMVPLAIATSIDALATGVTFAFLRVSIIPAVAFIGVTTFVFSALGLGIGHLFGAKYKTGAELFGGAVLILMGCKILLEHLNLI